MQVDRLRCDGRQTEREKHVATKHVERRDAGSAMAADRLLQDARQMQEDTRGIATKPVKQTSCIAMADGKGATVCCNVNRSMDYRERRMLTPKDGSYRYYRNKTYRVVYGNIIITDLCISREAPDSQDVNVSTGVNIPDL